MKDSSNPFLEMLISDSLCQSKAKIFCKVVVFSNRITDMNIWLATISYAGVRRWNLQRWEDVIRIYIRIFIHYLAEVINFPQPFKQTGIRSGINVQKKNIGYNQNIIESIKMIGG